MGETTDEIAKATAANEDRVRFYKDAGGEWRWQRRATNGEIIGASTEGYTKLSAARANYQRLQLFAPVANHDIEVDGEII